MKTDTYFRSYLGHSFLEWEMFQTKVVEKINTHILCSVTFFRNLYCLWDNVGKYCIETDRPQMTIWRMRIACWIPKATNTHSEYVLLISFPLLQWLHERASVSRYKNIACLVLLWRPGLGSMSVSGRFVVDKAAQGEIPLRVLRL